MWWLALIGWAGLSWAQDPGAASVVEPTDVEESEEALPSISSLRPRPLLGPDGLVWLGPFAPEMPVRGLTGVSQRVGDAIEDVLVVDADNGLLWLEVGGARAGRAVWTGRSWYRGEAPTDGTGVRVASDDEGVPKEVQWPDGSRVNLTFHDDMRVKSIEGPGNQVRRFEWDDILQTLRMTDGLGRVLSVRQLEGSQANQVIVQVEDTIGRSATSWWNYSEDGVAHVTKWKDPKGGQTKVRTRAGVTTVTGPTGRNWRLAVNGDTGRLAELVLPGGGAWRWGHDAQGNLTSMTDPMGRSTRWTRGPEGRVLGTEYLSRNIAYERDTAGNVVEIEELDGALVGLTRDSSGAVVSIEDPAGNAVRFARDADGKPISIVSRTGGRWALGYDLLGRPNRLVNPTDRVTTFQRNAQGHLTRILDSYFGDRVFERTSSGLVTRVTDTAGRVFELVRDALGRVHRVARPDGSVLAVTRDPLGDVIGVAIDGVRAQVKRDAVGRLLGVDVAGRSIRWSLFL